MIDKKEHRPVSLRSEVYNQFRLLQSKIQYEECRGASLSLSDTLVWLMDFYEKGGKSDLTAIREDIANINGILKSGVLLDAQNLENNKPENTDAPDEFEEILSRFKGSSD